MSVKWEEGIIGRTEAFLLDRFPIGKLTARSIPSSLVSLALSNTILPDKWGLVKANLWYFYIGRSGFAFKTPVVKFIRKIVTALNPMYVAPPKFTCQGFTEYVIGTKGSKKKERKQIMPHPVNYICRDEMSKLLGSRNYTYNAELGEYISELWDGHIEGYYTRGYQYEGNVEVYVVFWGASSEYFYELLNKTFFTQGLGNRPLWIVGEDRVPEELEDDFFFGFGRQDNELVALRKDIIDSLRLIEQNSQFAYLDADKMWRKFQHRMATEAYGDKTLEGMLKMKLAFNALKLAMVYSASIDHIDKKNKTIMISAEEMERAIEDTLAHEKMWKKAMERWNELKGDKSTPTHMSDKQKVIHYIKKNGGEITGGEMMHKTGWLKKDWEPIRDTMLKSREIVFKVIEKIDKLGRSRSVGIYVLGEQQDSDRSRSQKG